MKPATKTKLPVLRHQTWNAMIDEVMRRLPIKFVRFGQKWAHPWSIVPSWNPEREAWLLRIKPGFVNGLDAEIDLPAEIAPQRTLDRIQDTSGRKPEGRESVACRLTEFPDIPVGNNTRLIGKGANAESFSVTPSGMPVFQFEAVPEMFLTMGVKPESANFIGNLNTGIQVVETPDDDPGESPILRACDVALYLDRPSAKLDILRGVGALDSFNAVMTIIYNRSSPAREHPWLDITPKYRPRADIDLGDFLQESTDPEFDTLKIGTVYFLSPPGASPEDPMDETWNAFPKHDLFWNLAHAPQRIPDPTPIEPLRLQTGLAGGLADIIFADLLAMNNDAFLSAAQILRSRNLAGRFWSL